MSLNPKMSSKQFANVKSQQPVGYPGNISKHQTIFPAEKIILQIQSYPLLYLYVLTEK